MAAWFAFAQALALRGATNDATLVIAPGTASVGHPSGAALALNAAISPVGLPA